MYCDECGSKMLPSANMTGYSKKTGKPLFALWSYCKNKDCPRYRAKAPTEHLHKINASKVEAYRWENSEVK